MTDRELLSLSDEELLARVEAVAATGDRRATLILRQMIEDRQTTGEIDLFDRLACKPFVEGDRHAHRTSTRR